LSATVKNTKSYVKISTEFNGEKKMNQVELFEPITPSSEIEKVLLYALGDFQSRKKVLAERELALDRLRGAFKRAAEKYGISELGDEKIAENLEKLGAKVVRVPSFVAKHPFRVTVSNDLAFRAQKFYRQILKND
jgi:hypothetical protein